jgi:hypothetical protein
VGGFVPRISVGAAPADAQRLVDAWVEYLSRWTWDWFVILTFREAKHPEAAEKVFRVWISKMNRDMYGPRWSKHRRGVRWVRAQELQRRGAIHFHALLGGVSELRRLSWMDRWYELADGYARIEPPRDATAVRAYCAKYIVKGGEIDIDGELDPPPPSLFPLDGW